MPIYVNGVLIEDQAINVESANYDGGDILDRQNQAAVALVVRELLRQEIQDKGISEPSPQDVMQDGYEEESQEDALIRTLLAREVQTPDPDEESCRTYYEANVEHFREPDVYEVSHILVPALPDDDAAREIARDQAQELLQQLIERPETFEAAARANSACPSANEGGSLGRIGRGQTVPEFEEQLPRMTPDEICTWLVETRYGFHIVRLDDLIVGRQRSFEMVHGRVADYLRESVSRRAISQYLQLLASRAEITGIELGVGDTPLVR